MSRDDSTDASAREPQEAELTGKVALVTGAARRVGRAIALALADAGADIAFTWHSSAEAAATLVDAVSARGRRVLPIHVDHARADVADVVTRAWAERFARLDILVNNASTFERTNFGAISLASFERQMAVNARAPLLLMQSLAPVLARGYCAGDPASAGRIVNFIDIHVMGEPLRHFAAYNASKAALMEITATAALELAPAITVNAIAPGVVAWPDDFTAAERAEYLAKVPLGRAGTPLDAAKATMFLVRDAHYCTGQIIRLDGGRLLN